MLNCTQELSNKIADGNHWIVHNEVDVLDAHASRNAARAAKGENKVKQWDQKEGFNLVNGNSHDDSIQGVVDNLAAVGLQATVIDENTDFSKLGSGTEEQSEFAKDKETMGDIEPTVKPIDPVKEVKPKPEISHKSTVEKPTKLVHAIADMLAEANPDVTRKEIIAACTDAGIAYYTILTQYQAWKAARS